ncbi:hypothetical protein DNTS_034127 [Danionella cerebrum]|uniref:Signal-induced proliferation-associated 1-like protein C-terminal domain-containing protein n=1 Tax=Danionella cerebrum TaxID=2873325 RepID=A0A553R6T1_9TELE|nr:hypothetical protein DNTS_034127 [Danionella translucida]
MAYMFWDQNLDEPTKLPPLDFNSELRSSCPTGSHGNSSVHGGTDWPSFEQVKVTRLNPSRNAENREGEWHMVTATRSLRAKETRSSKECILGQQKIAYNSLPQARFVQPRAETDFSPHANDFWLNPEEIKNIGESQRNGRAQHPLTRPGFYSPQIPRSTRLDPAQSTRNGLKGSSSANNLKGFSTQTLPLQGSKTAVLKTSPWCSKPQEVKTSVVDKPPLMRAVISQTSPISSHLDKEHFRRHKPKDDRLTETKDCSLNNPGATSHRKDKLAWNMSQNLFTEDTSLRNHQSPVNQPSTLYPKLEKGSVDEPSQVDHEQSTLTQQDGSSKHKKRPYTHHQSDQNLVQSQVDGNSKNVFGQPRLIASLRTVSSPRPVRKSTVVEELKKLIVMDDTEDSAPGRSSPTQQKEVELCSSSPVSPSSVSWSIWSSDQKLFAESPDHLQQQTDYAGVPSQAESGLWQNPDPELMPLPSTASELDWNSLVQAAQEYEEQRMATLLSKITEMVPTLPDTASHGTYQLHLSSSDFSEDYQYNDVFIDFPDELSHLEGMVRRLSSDLLKEKRDKVALLAEVLKLRISNQHLREESLSAVTQLHKISNILNSPSEAPH